MILTPDAREAILWLLLGIVVIVVGDVLANMKNKAATMSETNWRMLFLGTPRKTFLYGLILGIILGTVAGHLWWQSARVGIALECESHGGKMVCEP